MKDEILRRDRAAGGIGNGTCGNRPAAGGTGHRIAVISDTHNLLRPEVVEIIKTCDAVLHGGDISGPETLEKIRRACGTAASYRIGGGGNFYAVRGNNDRDWAADIPYKLEVHLYGRKFFMTHKKKDIPADVDADVVIYGHSHKYAQEYVDGVLFLNPGSCGPRRFNQPITMAVLTIPEQDADPRAESSAGVCDGPAAERPRSYGITVEKIEIAQEQSCRQKNRSLQTSSERSARILKNIALSAISRRAGASAESSRT